MKVALHACCGPCSTVALRELSQQGHETAIFFSNSNIHPESEYLRRLETIEAYADALGISLTADEYAPNRWIDAIGECKEHTPERCRRCYRLRFERTASFAAENGFEAIATSLSVSPYQFTDVINEELEAAAQRHGLVALPADYREMYQDSVDMSREANMYRQNYCGCMYSMVEAAEERAERRRARKAAKLAAKSAEEREG